MSMADQEEEDIKMALKLSMQNHKSPEPKRSKSRENFSVEREVTLPSEAKNQLMQKELMAAAAKKRFAAGKSVESAMDVDNKGLEDVGKCKGVSVVNVEDKSGTSVIELSWIEANKLFLMIFGEEGTIKELVELVKKVVGYMGEIIWDSIKPDDTPKKLMDSSKLAGLGWESKVSLKDGLTDTYKWYSENIVGKK